MLYFSSDYLEGCHPAILDKLQETNLDQTPGYGHDVWCDLARERIREAVGKPDAAVHFLTGGTQANFAVIRSVLRSCEAVIAAQSGHIVDHEAGAVEACGHKVLTLPAECGKISAEQIAALVEKYRSDDAADFAVQPGMVYISHPTEWGTLYTLSELQAIHAVCRSFGIPLFIDGARLGYGLAAEGTDVTMKDIADNADVFYIGGTKVGALFGEAVVITNPGIMKNFFTTMKQSGAVLAKGRLLGIQFAVLFENDRYMEAGRHAIRLASRLRDALAEKGYEFYMPPESNQLFLKLTNDQFRRFKASVVFSLIDRLSDDEVVVRLVTGWATTPENVERLIAVL